MAVSSDKAQSTDGALSTAPASRRPPPGIVRVNLVPAEIAEARQVRITAFAMAGAAVLTLVVVGLLYHQQNSAVDAAQSQLAAARTTNAQLTGEQGRLGNVDALFAKVDAAQAMLTAAEAPQVLWSRYLEDLRVQLPEHVWLTNISATETGAAAATPVSATGTAAVHPGATTTTTAASQIGTLTFAGSAYTHDDVADLLDRLAGLRGLQNPYLASSTEALVGTASTAVPTVTWSTSAGLNSAALKSSYTSANGDATP